MRKIITFFILFFASVSVWAGDDVITASNFVPQAMLAKQIAPGTTRSFSLGNSYSSCDSKTASDTHIDYCKSPNSYIAKKDIGGHNFRIDVNLFNLSWPKTENPEGAANWNGHTFGGGLFLSAHYSIILEAGITPMLIQWLGPFYIGASYDLTLGHYFGTDEKNRFDASIHKSQFTGSLNLGGGFMAFMSNHGIGFGTHGGIRQIQILNVGYKQYTATDYRSGNRINPEYKGDYQIKEWIFYYGLDFLTYSNLPLLKESNSKGHYGLLFSTEFGLRNDKKPLIFFAFSISLML